MPEPAPAKETDVPFGFFVELVQAIAAIKPHKATERQPRGTRYVDTPAYKTLKRWVTALRERYSPLPEGMTSIVLRLLFPEDDVRRKYGMQETRLAHYLTKILGVSSSSHGRDERLRKWKGEDSLGCLGHEVETVMAGSSAVSASNMSLAHVDKLLSELAATCAFSASPVNRSPPTPRRTKEAILTELYTSLTPLECSVVTQIILKDLRPLLYPVPRSASHYTSALIEYKSNAIAMLSKEAAMHAWDSSGHLSMIFKMRANLEEATLAYEGFLKGEGLPQPTVGAPIQIPKCVKGQGPAHSLKTLQGADKIWVETKYDGERAQIHVWVDDDGAPRIRIFSKSGRDSTLDRAGIHHVVYDALGITHADSPDREVGAHACASDAPRFQQSIIVEAEMVAYSDVLDRIDEFWRIRSLIASTAIGVRHKSPPPVPSSTQQEAMETQCSLISNGSDGGTRHLALVFFDVLLLNGVSLSSFPYGERRAILERVINPKPGYAMFSERTCIDMKRKDAVEMFRRAFACVIADHQEGVVVKADGARYAERRWPWVKLKQDYIPGYGDAVDLVVLGASWEKERARELRVPPTAYTTFYFGALSNAQELRTHPRHAPCFEVIFTSSYGLGREQLEELNFIIKSSDPVPYSHRAVAGLSYSHRLCPSLSPPAILLRQPLLAEVFGAGFTKAAGNRCYGLRFPRISKIFRPSDRPWIDGTTFSDLQEIARTAVGRDRSGKAEDDWARSMFRPDEPPSPGVRCPVKRKRTEDMWVERLEAVDNKSATRSPTKRARAEGYSPKKAVKNSENVTEISRTGDSSKQRIGMPRLGSVTNLTLSSATESPHVASPLSPAGPHAKATFTLEPLRRLAEPRPQPDAPARLPPLPSLPPPPPLLPPNTHIMSPDTLALPQTPQRVRVYSPATISSGKSASTPSSASSRSAAASIFGPEEGSPLPPIGRPITLYEFLKDSVVFLARPVNSTRPTWRAPACAALPHGSQVQTVYALLVACGWDGMPPAVWASRGVVFVDEDEDRGAWLGQTMHEVALQRASALKSGVTTPPRPIFFFSMRMLAHDALGETAMLEDWESKAICRFG